MTLFSIVVMISLLDMEWPAMLGAFVLGLVFIIYRDYQRRHKKP